MVKQLCGILCIPSTIPSGALRQPQSPQTVPPTSPDTHLKGARNHAEKSEKNLIYARHSSKVVLLCVHRLPRIVAIPPCTKKRTVPIPREGTNRKNQGDKV